jgi:hypothetical protein
MLRIALSLFVALSLGFLSACTTTEAYDAKLNGWIGKSEKELVMGWGIPDKQYQLDANTKMISYVSHQTVVYPGSFEPCVAAVDRRGVLTSCPPQIPPSAETYHCETIFTIQNGHVARWGHKGNNCRA